MIKDIELYIRAAIYTYNPLFVEKVHPYRYEIEKGMRKHKEKEYSVEEILAVVMKHTIVKSNWRSGFTGGYYENPYTNEALVVFKSKDWIPNDTVDFVVLANGALSGQYKDALNFYLDMKKLHPNAHITVAGHSLGGLLAQAVGATTLCRTVTLNPWPARQLLPEIGLKPNLKFNNIENYVAHNDIIYLHMHSDSKDYLGTTYIALGEDNDPLTAHGDLHLSFWEVEFVKSEEWEKKHKGRNSTKYDVESFKSWSSSNLHEDSAKMIAQLLRFAS